MTTTTNPNGRVRKSLAEQIDRLDGILDGLADGLNEAVVTAVKDAVAVAVQEAVRGVLTEVLANPELLARVQGLTNPQPAAAPAAPPQPSQPTSWLRELLEKVWSGFRSGLSAVGQGCMNGLRWVGHQWNAAWKRVKMLGRFKCPLLVALGVGTDVGTMAYFAGPWLAAAAGWVAGFTVTLAVQAGVWLRRVVASPFSHKIFSGNGVQTNGFA
jgi:hypothetical protein